MKMFKIEYEDVGKCSYEYYYVLAKNEEDAVKYVEKNP
jgi:hypothetical protein